MTFAETVTEIMDRLNLTSSEATTRVGRLVNRYYKRVTTAVGINPAVRQSLTASANTTIGSAEITFTSMEKITRVWYLGSSSEKVFLDEVSLDELREEDPVSSDTPSRWATKTLGATSVVLLLDTLAATTHAIKADGYGIVSTLSGSTAPAFPESFHDILVEGVLQDEYKKLEKGPLATASKREYEERLSDLRMWVAKSKYQLIQQGQRPRNRSISRDSQGTP